MSDFISSIFKIFGFGAVPILIILAIAIWGFAHFVAATGKEVSVLWGLVKYTKAPIEISKKFVFTTILVAIIFACAVLGLRGFIDTTLSQTFSGMEPTIEIFESLTCERADTTGPVDLGKSPHAVKVRGKVSNAMNYYVYLIVVDDNIGFIEPGLGARVDNDFFGNCYLGKSDDPTSLNKTYYIFAVVSNREYKPYEHLVRKTILKQSNTIEIKRTY